MHFHAENRNFDLPCMASKYIQPKSNQNVTENDTQLLSVIDFLLLETFVQKCTLHRGFLCINLKCTLQNQSQKLTILKLK